VQNLRVRAPQSRLVGGQAWLKGASLNGIPGQGVEVY
jgi:hypothetical protein